MADKKENKRRVSLRLDQDIYNKIDSARSYGETFTASLEKILKVNLTHVDILNSIDDSTDKLEEAIYFSNNDPDTFRYWRSKYIDLKDRIMGTQTSEGWIEINDVKKIISELAEAE